MGIFKKLLIFHKVSRYLFLFLFMYFMNDLLVLGSESKSNFTKNKNKFYQFEKIFFKNSTPYSEYDSYENQLKTFLGYDSHKSFPDFPMMNVSNEIREMYISKLNSMAENKIIYNIENKLYFKN